MNVIYIMWKRQIVRFVRARSRLLSSLFQPVLFLITFNFGFGSYINQAEEVDYLSILAPGIILMTLFFTSMMNGIQLIWDKRFGFLKETLVAPISRVKVLFGRTLGGATIATFQGVLILIITIFFGFAPSSFFAFFISILIMFFISFIFTLFGTIIASVVNSFEAFPAIMNFVNMPLFFLSGSLFPISQFPEVLQKLVYFNPLYYSVELLRGELIGIVSIRPIISFLVLILLALAAMVIGVDRFNRIEP